METFFSGTHHDLLKTIKPSDEIFWGSTLYIDSTTSLRWNRVKRQFQIRL